MSTGVSHAGTSEKEKSKIKDRFRFSPRSKGSYSLICTEAIRLRNELHSHNFLALGQQMVALRGIL